MKNSTLDNAKQCPFCAYPDSRIETLDKGNHKEYVVMCLNCGAFGPSEMYTQNAFQMWNLRRTEFPSRPRNLATAPVSEDTDCEEVA